MTTELEDDDFEFEPFGDLSIWCRKRTVDCLMAVAPIAFNVEVSDVERAEYQEKLWVRLAHLRHLADIALAKQPSEWGISPGALMEMARIAFGDHHSKDLRADALAMLKERLVRLVQLAEIGLAAPQPSQRLQ